MITIAFPDDAGRDLNKIADQLAAGLPDVMLAIGVEMAGYVSEDFEAKSRGNTGEGGISWAPLADATIKKKAKRAKGGNTSTQIGVDTGLLRSTIQPGFKAPDSKGGNILEATGNEVTVGFGRSYAKYFDEGNTRGMPARPLIPETMPKEWEEAAEEILKDGIEQIWHETLGE